MAPYKPASVGAARLVPMAIREGKLAVARLPPPVFPACVPAMLPLLDHSLSPLRRPAGAWRRSLVGVGVAAFVIGAASPLLARPPYGDPPPQGRYQIGDADRAEIRRSMGRPGADAQPDPYRERRRMSDAERQSLRQAVRDAYGDPRARRH